MPGFQPSFVVHTTYVENAAMSRAPYRQAHLERLQRLFEEGALLLAGAYEDMSGGFFVFALENEDAVRAIIDTDIYLRNGVWTSYVVKPFLRVDFEAS